MEKLSLIITVYNKADFLVRCLESVVGQAYKEAQIIVVDDGSTDNSKKICEDYAKRYGWELYRTKNQGVAEARNVGLDKATGDYITFLDADDALATDALEIMSKIARHGFNIYQFGQYRCRGMTAYKDHFSKGHYTLDRMPKRWAMVWNKLYKRSFLKKHKIRFIKGMQFGEDELFNIRCVFANNGLYHAPQTLMYHYFDDTKSLCRGQLSKEKFERLIEELVKLKSKQKDPRKKQWLENKIRAHETSALFARYGYHAKSKGKYDIVYFLKQSPTNEELRYSLRSVEENWQYNKVWFYGGCPGGLKPDCYVYMPQREPSKWERVRGMLYAACNNDEITEDFWLFNDDFFILKPIRETMPPQYNTTLQERIRKIEKRHGGRSDDYTTRLRHLVKTLERAGKGFLDYSVHKPILINRKKMLEVLDKFPDEPMSRALYGNYWGIGGVSKHDMKIKVLRYERMDEVMRDWEFLSTSDESFTNGVAGRYLRDKFKNKSKFEI